jgi:PAS domain S-box-containing protein
LDPNVNTQESSARLRKVLFFYLAAALLVLTLSFALTISLTLFGQMKDAEDKSLVNAARTRAMTVAEWCRRAKDLALQITSRSRIRQELEKHNKGMITLEQVNAFTEPKLEDAMKMSADILGILRFDIHDHTIAACGAGVDLPISDKHIDEYIFDDIVLLEPIPINGRLSIVVSAPIRDRSGERQGTDLVILDTDRLLAIASDSKPIGRTSRIVIGYSSRANGATLFPAKGDTAESPIDVEISNAITASISKAIAGKTGIDRVSDLIVAFTPVMDSGWGLAITQNAKELYLPLYRKMGNIGLLFLLIYLLIVFGFGFVMKPLAGRILLHADDLEREVQSKTAVLEEEIVKRTEAEHLLREKEQFLTSVFDSIQDGISVLSPDLKIVRTNKAMQELYRQHVPLEGKSCFEVYRASDQPCSDCPVVRSIESLTLEKLERPLIQEGRQTGTIELYAFPIINEDGKVSGIVEYVRDISRQKEDEQKLIDLKRKLETAQQLAKSGWWEYDVQKDVVIWPDETYVLYGLDPRTTVLNYKTLLECIDPDYHEYHDKQLQVIIEKGAADFQYPIKRSDGEQRWMWAKGETEYDEDGNPVRLFGSIQDITERIKIEEQLRLQAQVMGQVHDSIITVAMDGTITNWNRGSEHLFEYREQEVLGRHISLVYPETSHEMLQNEIIPNLLNKKRLEIETTLIRKGNQPFEAMVSLSVLTNESGELTGMIGYTLDITERKMAERALADSEKRLADIIEFLPDPTFVIDTNGRVISWNRAIERLTGINKKEMIGKGGYAYAVPFYGEPRPLIIDLVLERNQQWESGYLTLNDKDGLLIESESFHPSMGNGGRYFAGTAGKLYDAQGHVVGAIETIRDITLAKKTEQDREQLIIELKEAIAKVRTLSGLLPMCAHCKKIRDDKGYWSQLETYIGRHTDADVSHGLCPECMDELYGGQDWYEQGKRKGKF